MRGSAARSAVFEHSEKDGRKLVQKEHRAGRRSPTGSRRSLGSWRRVHFLLLICVAADWTCVWATERIRVV